ncbi:bifunctional metallophosphatase/5'-nucleotidase [Bacteroidota bacterium]
MIIKLLREIPVVLSFLILSTISLYSQTQTFTIIQTTDEHGKIFPYNFKEDNDSEGSLAQLYTFVNEKRGNENQEVILLSGGDILQGTPAVYYYNFEDTSGIHLYADVMNYLGYDAGAVGNHDIETGHSVYDKLTKQLNFPWLAANAVNKGTNKPYFQPYAVIKRGNFKIAILGLITPAIPKWLPEKLWEGIEFEDMIESARKWVKIILEKESPDLLIGLFHAGVDYTYGNQNADTHKNENASQLVAERVRGFDIVFVGHDHRGWNKPIKNHWGEDVLILGASSYARDAAIGKVDFIYNSEIERWEKEISGSTTDLRKFEPDKGFINKFHQNFITIRNYVSKPIGKFLKTISTREALFGTSSFVDLIHQIQLDLSGADISFAATLSFDSKIDSGKVFIRDMFKLYKYENFLYTISMTGKEIENYLEYSYSIWFNTMQNEEDHLLRFETDSLGNLIFSKRNNSPILYSSYYNFDSACGLNYVIDITKPNGEKVSIESLSNGNKFCSDSIYTVAVNSYRGNGGGGHLTDGANIPKDSLSKRIITSTEKDLRYYMMRWIEQKEEVTPKLFGNWKIIPEDLWFKGMKRDYKILYGFNN